jgi:hypothetical protein
VGRNLGIEKARGEYVTFLDAGDAYPPGFLSFVDEATRACPDRTLYAVGGVSVTADGARTPPGPTMAAGAPRELSLAEVVRMELLPDMVAYPAEAIRELGGFRACHAEDYDLWVRALAGGGTGVCVPAGLSGHRVVRTSRSHDPAAHEATLESELCSLRDALAHDLKDGDRRSVEERVASLEKLLEPIRARAGLEERLRAGDYRGARAAYLRAAPAYRRRGRYLAGLAVMLVSPRLFTRARLRHGPGA